MMTRRQYLKRVSAFTSGLILNHSVFSMPFNYEIESQLIREVHLQTSADLKSMVQFYSGKMGFDTLYKDEHKCTFKTGNSIVTFNRVETNNRPHYHFAFNISEQKIKQAELWLKSNDIEIIKPPNSLTQIPEFSKNIVYFRHWDAHAVFFYDPAGNVVELIARHTLKDGQTGNFSESDIHYVSEIGLVTDNVAVLSKEITKALHLTSYNRQSDRFAAIGNEAGLILCFQSGRRAVFGEGRKRQVFKTDIRLMDNSDDLSFKNNDFRIYS